MYIWCLSFKNLTTANQFVSRSAPHHISHILLDCFHEKIFKVVTMTSFRNFWSVSLQIRFHHYGVACTRMKELETARKKNFFLSQIYCPSFLFSISPENTKQWFSPCKYKLQSLRAEANFILLFFKVKVSHCLVFVLYDEDEKDD